MLVSRLLFSWYLDRKKIFFCVSECGNIRAVGIGVRFDNWQRSPRSVFTLCNSVYFKTTWQSPTSSQLFRIQLKTQNIFSNFFIYLPPKSFRQRIILAKGVLGLLRNKMRFACCACKCATVKKGSKQTFFRAEIALLWSRVTMSETQNCTARRMKKGFCWHC